jgi:hypothetical protein
MIKQREPGQGPSKSLLPTLPQQRGDVPGSRCPSRRCHRFRPESWWNPAGGWIVHIRLPAISSARGYRLIPISDMGDHFPCTLIRQKVKNSCEVPI